jgi:uncharacterized protein (DUF885 family)
MIAAFVVTGLALAGGGVGVSAGEEYLEALWKHSPITASAAGYHQDGVDARLDDLGEAERGRRAAWLREFEKRLLTAGVVMNRTEQDDADLELLHAAVALELLDLTEARDFSRRADLPLDTLGSAFFQMVARPYAPPERLTADVDARLSEVPRYLAQAQAALAESVDAFRDAARDDGDGLIDYLQHDLLDAFAKSPALPKLRARVDAAVAAVRAYLKFVADELPKKPKRSFRYGRALYDKRFGPYLQTQRAPAEVLAAAQARVRELHAAMKKLAAKIVPGGDVRAALDAIARDHVAAGEFFAAVRKQVDDARRFVREHKLLTLPPRDNLRVIETPPFLRSQLGVAAFDGAPPLAPTADAFYYVTPFSTSPSQADAVERKLREYNRYMSALLTIHEAMPGHYVQFEHAQAVEPVPRRVLRWLVGSGAYVEGWAMYAQDLLVDAGFMDHDPKLQLQEYKLELRAVVNTILDIRMHTTELSDAEALSLLMDTAFQERTEAELKLRRAKLSVTQLCSYFVGNEAWRALRREAEKRRGFDVTKFHDRALGMGAVTLTTLRALLR